MVGRTEAYKQGYLAKHYRNPYPRNSTEFNDFERGWSQRIKSIRPAPPLKYYQNDQMAQSNVQASKPSCKSPNSATKYNPYAEAKGK